MSLNQLTENYTDSEGEEDFKPQSVSSEESSSLKGTPNSGSLAVSKKKIDRLVSYANDEEEDHLEEGQIDESVECINSEPMDIGSDEPEDEKPVIERDLGIKLPAAPPGKCSANLQEKICKFLHKVENENMDYNRYIQNNKAFRNPSIYEKLISHLSLDEQGSNYPLEIFDPHCWGKESHYDELAHVQREEMEKRERERKERPKNESGISVKKPMEEEAKKRKSRFDQGAPNNTVLKSVPPPSLTSVASGNKAAINAFGVLKNK